MVTEGPSTNHILQAALTWHEAGCSVIPIRADGTKRPAVAWKQYQSERADAGQVASWFTAHPEWGIGVVCGAVSGNLEMLEFEGRAMNIDAVIAVDEQIEAHDVDADGLIHRWNQIQKGYSEWTPSGGLHVLYRLPAGIDVPGNTKLAMNETRECLAETRGEGGYVIVAPTGGAVHSTGAEWTTLRGTPATISTITEPLRWSLHDAITAALNVPEAVDEVFVSAPTPNTAPRNDAEGLTPGDDFTERTGWGTILIPHGWEVHSRLGDEVFWTRPGKDRRDGHSASTGYRHGSDCLYVWSSSTGLPIERPLSKLFVHAYYNHRGDMSAAAKSLASQGYGSRPNPQSKDNDDFFAAYQLGTVERSVPQPLDLAEQAQRQSEPRNNLRITPASAFVIKRVRWLWEGRVPLGEITLIPGREGAGKSLILAKLAADITNGRLIGEFFGTPRDVLYVASEDSWNHTIAPRLQAAGCDMDRVHRLDTDPDGEYGAGAPVLPRDCRPIADIALSINAGAIMFDPIVSLIDPSIDTHKAQQLRTALEPLRRAAEVADMAILALAHFNKSTGSDVSSKVAGSRAWLEVARASFAVAQLPADEDDIDDTESGLEMRSYQHVLSQTKNNLGRTNVPNLTYVIDEVFIPAEDGEASVGRVRFTGESAMGVEEALEHRKSEPSTASGTVARVVDYVNDVFMRGGGLAIPAAEILQWFENAPDPVQAATVRVLLSRAVKRNLLESPQRGMYRPKD